MNGALGWVKGFMWPVGGDPLSPEDSLRAPICVFVEFDDVQLGVEQRATGERVERSFCPDDPEKRRWVPIFSEKAESRAEDKVARHQFPLILAWALSHWKAQGMTLNYVRIALGDRVASSAGVGYVAATRVKHSRRMVFESDLPAWEVFQVAKYSKIFRSRRRFELRLEARAGWTILN